MAIMAKINKKYIDNVVQWIKFNEMSGISISQRDIYRQYKIDVDDILKYCLKAERLFYGYNRYEIEYLTDSYNKYNVKIIIE